MLQSIGNRLTFRVMALSEASQFDFVTIHYRAYARQNERGDLFKHKGGIGNVFYVGFYSYGIAIGVGCENRGNFYKLTLLNHLKSTVYAIGGNISQLFTL